MEEFHTYNPRQLPGNMTQRIAEQWMLITAGSPAEGIATMTANWGATGYLWNRDFVLVAIRHSRNTLPYLQRSGGFSLGFFSEEYREKLAYCGRVSGRDEDKPAHCGFTVEYLNGIPYFRQSNTVLICKTMYEGDITPEGFRDRTLLQRWYEEGAHAGDMHRFFLASIEAVQVKEAN